MFSIISLFSNLFIGVNSLEYISMYINTNDPVFYPYSIKVNKCSGTCNNINDPYGKICIPNIIKKN